MIFSLGLNVSYPFPAWINNYYKNNYDKKPSTIFSVKNCFNVYKRVVKFRTTVKSGYDGQSGANHKIKNCQNLETKSLWILYNFISYWHTLLTSLNSLKYVEFFFLFGQKLDFLDLLSCIPPVRILRTRSFLPYPLFSHPDLNWRTDSALNSLLEVFFIRMIIRLIAMILKY